MDPRAGGMIADVQRFSLGYLPRRAALAYPNRVAVVDLGETPLREVTYAELELRIARVAALFASLGAEAGDRVALIVGSGLTFVEAMYGAYRAGLVPVSLNPRLGREALAATLAAAGTRFAVLDPRIDGAIAEAATGLVEQRLVVGGAASGPGEIAYEEALAAVDVKRFPQPLVLSSALAELAFTSGSTGAPKGVMLSHRALLLKYYLLGNNLRALFGGPIRSLVHLPIFHANGRNAVALAFETGGCATIMPRFDPVATLEAIAPHEINYLFSVSAAYMRMLEAAETTGPLELPSLRYTFVGSGPSSAETLRRAEELLGARMLQAYGSTEGGTVFQQRADERYEPDSCGSLVPGNEIRLLDHDGAEADGFGELWIRNEWSADGYWELPELTAERFVDGWYRSGDLFERDAAGHMYWRGRADDLILVGGENLYPAEVERLLEAHPEVLAATVVPVQHPSKGQVPAAMVVVEPDAGIDEEALIAHSLADGPAFAHPRRVAIVEAFPVGPTGKVDRREVARQLEALGLERPATPAAPGD